VTAKPIKRVHDYISQLLMKPTTEEEIAFMNDLFSNLDDSISGLPSHPLSPSNLITPVKSKPLNDSERATVSTQVFSADDVDLVGLMDGLEDCDWGDMEADFLSPKKCRVVEPPKVISCLYVITSR
jgi:hypothetical protein